MLTQPVLVYDDSAAPATATLALDNAASPAGPMAPARRGQDRPVQAVATLRRSNLRAVR